MIRDEGGCIFSFFGLEKICINLVMFSLSFVVNCIFGRKKKDYWIN